MLPPLCKMSDVIWVTSLHKFAFPSTGWTHFHSLNTLPKSEHSSTRPQCEHTSPVWAQCQRPKNKLGSVYSRSRKGTSAQHQNNLCFNRPFIFKYVESRLCFSTHLLVLLPRSIFTGRSNKLLVRQTRTKWNHMSGKTEPPLPINVSNKLQLGLTHQSTKHCHHK